MLLSWSGEIPADLANKAEAIQTDFARAVLGLQGQWGVPNVLVRAELGLEKLESRWEKLRLGYWRRIQVAQPSRALVAVARARRWQLMWGGAGMGRLSWMVGTRQLLRSRGVADTGATQLVAPSFRRASGRAWCTTGSRPITRRREGARQHM